MSSTAPGLPSTRGVAATDPAAEALFISHSPKANGMQVSAVSAWRVVKEATAGLADGAERWT